MPFQSEKQRRYLWANEPEIARDWTDTYGSGIAKALGGRIPFGSGGNYDWSSENNPELLQKMNDAVDKAVNDYLGKIKSGKISFPDNLQLEIDKVGDKARHDMIQSQSDQPEIFSETLQEGLDKSNIQQKQKRSIEQELLDEMNQTRLSDEDWLEEADARQLTAESPLFMRDFTYDVTAPQTTRGPMADEMWATPDEGIASIDPHGWEYGDQWQTAETEDENQWKMPNLNTLSKWGSGIYSALKGRMPWTLGAQALNFMGGRNRGPVINPSTQRFMQNYNGGRNPQTGRMVGGPFAGRNLPGTSMFGSKTPQQMAQNWMSKYGSMDYNTERQIAKQKEIRDIAAGNTNLPPSERTITPTRTHTPSGPTHSPHRDQPHGTDTSGSFAGKGSGNPFGRARGGLAGLWQR